MTQNSSAAPSGPVAPAATPLAAKRSVPEVEAFAEHFKTMSQLDPEDALKAMLGECYLLMGHIAFRRIQKAAEPRECLDFMHSSVRCAEAGAKLAHAVAKLRATAAKDQSFAALATLLASAGKTEQQENPENNDQALASG